MKKFIFFIAFVFLTFFIHAQNTGIGTITPEGRLHVKGNSDASQLIVDANSVQANTNSLFRLRNASGRDLLTLHSDDSTNVFLGTNTGKLNSAMLYSDVKGKHNIFIGRNVGTNNTNGYVNTAVGGLALSTNSLGYHNAAFGASALQNNTTGTVNTAVGYAALFSNTTGTNNTAVGYYADVLSNNLFNATAIGYNAKVSASNCLVLGSDANVGIGVSAPVARLHVAGSAKIFTGATTYTGDFWFGNASVNGFEVVSSGGDTYLGLQRSVGANIHLSKPAGITGALASFFVNGSVVGVISTNGATTSYGTASDVRLKANRRPSNYGLNTLMKIEVEDYNYTSDKQQTSHTGFIAQELYKVYPQAVEVGGNDAATKAWMIDYGKITPLLVKAVQEQQAIIEQQKNEIEIHTKEIEKIKQQLQQVIGTLQSNTKN